MRFPIIKRGVLAAASIFAISIHAQAGGFNNITVGQAGLAGNCTVATIQEAINLAAANPGPDTIWVTRDTPLGYYLAANALTVNDPNVEIVGGFDDCLDETPSGTTDISGNGNAADPVFRIRGTSSVRLQNLLITLGDADGNEGAGIDFQGSGILEVVDSVIEYNNTQGGNFGGGIRVDSSAGVDLAIANSRINNNSAQSGGGISFEGPGRVILNNTSVYANQARDDGGGLFLRGGISAYFERGVTISGNKAIDDGGGVYSKGNVYLEWNGVDAQMWFNEAGDAGGGGYFEESGALANLSPRGPLLNGQYAGVFYANKAKRGGALAALDGGDIQVTSRDGGSAQVLSFNQALERGGALLVGASSYIQLIDTSLISNTAPRGAAIYGEGGWLFVNESLFFTNPNPNPNPARCRNRSLHCSDIARNIASPGRVIEMERLPGTSGFYVWITRARFFENQGQQLFWLADLNDFRLRDSVLDFNQTSSYLMNLSDPTFARIQNNTVINNQIAETSVIRVSAIGSDELISANIFAQPDKRSVFSGNTIPSAQVTENLSNDPILAGINASNLTGTPIFQAAPALYELRRDSPGVDYTALRSGRRDFLFRLYVDLPPVANGAGFGDVGAMENQDVFWNGFED